MLPLRGLPEYVQVCPHQGVLHLRDVVVELHDVRFKAFRPRIRIGKAQVVQHLGVPGGLVDVLHHLPAALGVVRALVPEVLLQRDLHLGYVVVSAGARHRRRHVPVEHRLGAALALDPLARVIDDVDVEVRHIPEHDIWVAFGREPDVLPGEPFQGPVGPDVDDDVRFEHVPDPAVICQILVLGEQQRVVDALLELVGHAAEGLVADEDVAFDEPGDDDLPAVGADLPWRRSPVLLHHGAVPFRHFGVFLEVVIPVHEGRGLLPDRLQGHGIEVVGDVVQNLGDERLPVLRDVLDGVPLILHPPEEPGDALHGVEAGGVPDDP